MSDSFHAKITVSNLPFVLVTGRLMPGQSGFERDERNFVSEISPTPAVSHKPCGEISKKTRQNVEFPHVSS